MTLWTDSLIIGDVKIDHQHRKLVEAIDKFIDACKLGKGRNTIAETLNFIVVYTIKHFNDEEELQIKYAFPHYGEHKLLHTQFLTTVRNLQQEFDKEGPTAALTSKINKTLVDWLIKHVNNEDKQIGEHLKKARKS